MRTIVCFLLNRLNTAFSFTAKPVLSGHSKRRSNLVFKPHYRSMQVKSIAESSKGSILQYFWPSLSYKHSAILLAFIKLPLVIKIFILSVFEWPLRTGFTVLFYLFQRDRKHVSSVVSLFLLSQVNTRTGPVQCLQYATK